MSRKDRLSDAKVPAERDKGTPEHILQRTARISYLLTRYPEGVARQLAEQQNAGWFIGQLYLIEAISREEMEAAKRWLEISREYRKLLDVPKPPGAIDMNKREPGAPLAFEDARATAKYKRLKRQYEQCHDAVSSCGPTVLKFTVDALNDEFVPLIVLKQGLMALVRV